MRISDLKRAKVDELLVMYANAAVAHGQATIKGDFRNGNPQADIIFAIYRELRARGESAQHSLLSLIGHSDSSVRCWVAAHAMEFAPDRGQPVLEALSQEQGLIAFTAEMTLEQWKKGKLKFP